MEIMKKNLIVTLADRNYINQAKQLFSSVYWNAGWKGDYMLLAHDIPEKELRWFRNKGILIKKCKSLYHKDFGRISRAVLDKFYLFTPEFKKWKNIVFLDGDIIVRASLDELTNINGFAAMPENILEDQFVKSSQQLIKLKKIYNLKEPRFNAGVMAFSTNIIKKDSFSKLKLLFKKYEKVHLFQDQTVLNLFFYKKWIKMPQVYNVPPYLIAHPYFIKRNKLKAIILHFIGERKPWHLEDPFYKEWNDNLKKAELIDLNKTVSAKKWTNKDIKRYSQYIKRRQIIYLPIYYIDRFIGKIGRLIKKG